MKNLHRCFLLAGVGAVMSGPALAAPYLVFDNTVTVTGTGNGAVPTILTIQPANGQLTTETGCVRRFNGSDQEGTLACASYGAPFTGGNDQQNSQTQTQPLSAADISNVSELAIVFDVSQSGGGNVHLDAMTLRIYNGDTVVCQVPVDPADAVNYAGAGGGQSAHPFILNSDAQTACALANGNSSYRVGLAGRASDANDGPESWFLAKVAGAPGEGSAQVCVTKVASGSTVGQQVFTFSATDKNQQQTSVGGTVCWQYAIDDDPIQVTLEETVPVGWTSNGVQCDNEKGGSENNSIDIELGDEDNVICTFTNTQNLAATPVPTMGAFGLGALGLMLAGLARRRMR